MTMEDASFTTKPRPLEELLKHAGSGKIQLPDFQRSWVWDEDRIIDLLVSISRAFPIGAVMSLKTGGEVNFHPRPVQGAPEPTKENPEELLLDGQQRITSIVDVNRQLENMLDRIVEAKSTSVVSAYETRIDKLERDKLVLNDRIEKSVPPKGRLEDCIELSLKFLSSPWNIWKNGDFVMRQAVLRLAFAEPLRYSQNGVYETPKFSFPFKFLGEFSGSKSEMVLLGRIELPTSSLPMCFSNS
ncbi:hypothetical protein RB2150_06068 [Rhodobacterales bacterium HTCC2150]|nr:hypothetical protein RB2150_06068 [Rhodobacterales bacterium HTCC2150] [Rhodobacteraceae bacterium HTCC2150]